jgi:hypothetical protein
MKNIVVLGLAVTLIAGFPAKRAIAANSPDDNIPALTTTKQKALDLIQQQYSAEKITKQVSLVLDKALPQSLASDRQFIELEAAYPGLQDVLIGAIKPVMLKAYTDKLPLLWDQLTNLYAENLTVTEIDQISAFSKSAVGIRYAAALHQNQNMSPVVDAARNAGGMDASVTTASRREQMTMIRKATSEISNSDRLAIFRFENSIAGAKITKMVPKLQDILLKWDFYFTEQQKASFIDVRTLALRDFMAKSDALAAQPRKIGKD